MNKLDKLRRVGLGHAAESMGVGVGPSAATATPTAADDPAADPRFAGISRHRDAATIAIDRIDRDPDQPRAEFDDDDLARLAESMRARGQIQPITVYWDEGRGCYTILCGERRWRAAKLAGMAGLSAIILKQPPDPSQRLALQLIENLQRTDLSPLEEARGYRQLIEGQGWSAAQVARELAVTESKVSRALALLDLPEPIRDQVDAGALSAATAYELTKLRDLDARAELAERVLTERLTRQATAEAVRDRRGYTPRPPRPPAAVESQPEPAPAPAAPEPAPPHTSRRQPAATVEIVTPFGTVAVTSTPGDLIAALEAALAQARSRAVAAA